MNNDSYNTASHAVYNKAYNDMYNHVLSCGASEQTAHEEGCEHGHEQVMEWQYENPERDWKVQS